MVYDGSVEHAARASGRVVTTRCVGDIASDRIVVLGIENAEFSHLVGVLATCNPGFSRDFLHLFRWYARGAAGAILKPRVVE